MIRLDARLKAICELAGECPLMADIGADHGRLGAYMLSTNRAGRVMFTDISAPSLDKARGLIDRLGLSARADFLVGDGAKPLPRAPDVAVIAGMGGITIAEIVNKGARELGGAQIVVQPNVAQYDMRKALARAGYLILDERVARADGRRYIVIALERGCAEYDERELLIGPVLLRRGGAELKDYARFQARVLTKAAQGARGADAARARELARHAKMWEEIT